MNNVNLIGRLVSQPELKYTNGSNIAVCSFRIAVDRRFKDKNGQKITDFIDCVAWRQQAEFLCNYIEKGKLIALSGELQVRQWQAQDGTNRRTAEVIIDFIQSLEKREYETVSSASEEDIPQPPSPFSSQNFTGNTADPDTYDPFSEE